MEKRIYFILGLILILVGRTQKFINYEEFILAGEIILAISSLFFFADFIKFIDKKLFKK